MHCFVNVEMTYFDIVHMMLDYDCTVGWLVGGWWLLVGGS